MIFLQTMLLALHLLGMNIASSGPLACVALQFASRRNDTLRPLGQTIALWSFGCFIFGVLVGLTSGFIIWQTGEVRFFQALERLPSKIHFGIWELVFYVVCMGIYLLWWKIRPPQGWTANIFLAIIALAAATNLLWHFPALMTVIAHLAATEPTGEAIGPSGFRALMFTDAVMSRWLHVWMASFATTGLLVSWAALSRISTSDEAPEASDAARRLNSASLWGGRIALAATLAQLPLGMWLLMTSSQAEQSRLMGGDLLATGLFLASLAAALGLLHQLAALSLGHGTRRNANLAWLLLLVTIVCMSGTLLLARGDAFRLP